MIYRTGNDLLCDKCREKATVISKMEKCKTCTHYDKEKSNKNWVVCKGTNMPVEVVITGTSENCKNYQGVTPTKQPPQQSPKP